MQENCVKNYEKICADIKQKKEAIYYRETGLQAINYGKHPGRERSRKYNFRKHRFPILHSIFVAVKKRC